MSIHTDDNDATFSSDATVDVPDNGYNLHRRIHDSKGMAYLGRQKARSFSVNIFKMNAKELKDMLELLENPKIGLALMAENNRDAGHQAHREVNRYVHNFVASAMTLVEHTRIFIRREYSNTPLATMYQAKIDKEIRNDELCKFVQDFRNYMLHRELPNSEMFVSYTKTEDGGMINTGVVYKVENLKNWDGWTVPSKGFLEKQGENLNLREIAVKYEEKVLKLHDWLEEALNEHHRDELEELYALQEEYNAKYPSSDGNEDDDEEPVRGSSAQINEESIGSGLFVTVSV
ncbi:MAG TPA: hypothetical protein VF601_14230 [Beijerinckiaceae bacterium]|jgi:hypothetical protein